MTPLFFRLTQFIVLLSYMYMKQLGQIKGDNNLYTQASFRSKIQKLKIYTILLDKTRPLQPSETSLSYWIQFVAFSFPYHMHWMLIFCCPFADGGIIGVEQKRVSTSEFFQIITGAPTKQVGLYGVSQSSPPRMSTHCTEAISYWINGIAIAKPGKYKLINQFFSFRCLKSY